MRGRKPKPTRLRLIQGNPGRRAINRNEPQPLGDLLEAPDWLTADQLAGWEYAIRRAPKGLIKELDRALLTIWVVAEDLHKTACINQTRLDAGKQLPLLFSTPLQRQLVQSPYLPIINRQALIMLKAGAELGFTPASRPRIAVDVSTANPDARALFGF